VEGQPLRPIACRRARFTNDETGATMLEYGLLLLLVVLVVVGVAKLLGQNVLSLYDIGKFL
jgi:Flp pilus assembly pilin Flp